MRAEKTNSQLTVCGQFAALTPSRTSVCVCVWTLVLLPASVWDSFQVLRLIPTVQEHAFKIKIAASESSRAVIEDSCLPPCKK